MGEKKKKMELFWGGNRREWIFPFPPAVAAYVGALAQPNPFPSSSCSEIWHIGSGSGRAGEDPPKEEKGRRHTFISLKSP